MTDSKQAGTLLSSTSVEKSNAGRRHGSGEAISTSQTGDSLTSGSAHMLSDASTVPTGSFQFQADWKTLKNRPEEFYTYFKVIHSFGVIFTVQLHVMQRTVLLSQFCPSVCLSDACIVTKLNNALRIF